MYEQYAKDNHCGLQPRRLIMRHVGHQGTMELMRGSIELQVYMLDDKCRCEHRIQGGMNQPSSIYKVNWNRMGCEVSSTCLV